MSRPKIEKCICNIPKYDEFVTVNGASDKVIMTYEEYETIRMIDYKGLMQEECASRMGVSRPTVQLIYTRARAKMADFLVNGKSLVIEGGNYKVCEAKNNLCESGHCEKCGGKD